MATESHGTATTDAALQGRRTVLPQRWHNFGEINLEESLKVTAGGVEVMGQEWKWKSSRPKKGAKLLQWKWNSGEVRANAAERLHGVCLNDGRRMTTFPKHVSDTHIEREKCTGDSETDCSVLASIEKSPKLSSNCGLDGCAHNTAA